MGFAHGRASVGNRWRWRRRAELADGRFAHESCDRHRLPSSSRPAYSDWLLVAAMVSRSSTALRSTSVVVVDALISIPTVLIALMLSVPFGASAAVIVAACGFAYGLNLARIVRPAAILAARSQYVESAVWSGSFGGARVRQAYYAERDAGAAGAVVDERRDVDTG